MPEAASISSTTAASLRLVQATNTASTEGSCASSMAASRKDCGAMQATSLSFSLLKEPITGTPMPGVAPRVTGMSANTLTGTPAGNAAASPGNGAAPRSAQALQSANVPIKSEKAGTASPSADIKKTQTKAMPAGASPSVDRGNSKEVKN